jgi:hypothetical protein
MTELLTHPNGVTTAMPSIVAASGPKAARDFSRTRKRLNFTVDGEEFESTPGLPGDIYAEFVTIYSSTGEGKTYQEQHDALKQALSLVLLDESWAGFEACLPDKKRPIDDDQMSDVVLWLLEEYANRPTQPSQPSSDGQPAPESGTSSTENTQPAESTSAPSQPTAS